MMRLLKQVQQLTEKSSTVVWPKSPDTSFERFRSLLEKVVQANLDLEAERSLTWDETSQHFFFTQREVTAMGGVSADATATFGIDPSKSIEGELTRVLVEVTSFRTACKQAWHEYSAAKEWAIAAAGKS